MIIEINDAVVKSTEFSAITKIIAVSSCASVSRNSAIVQCTAINATASIAANLAIVRARVVQDVAALVERERITVLLVTHDLEEAISLSDRIYLLSRGPRAHVTHEYRTALPRPRDPVRARTHEGFAPLYEKIWTDLSHEIDDIQ